MVSVGKVISLRMHSNPERAQQISLNDRPKILGTSNYSIIVSGQRCSQYITPYLSHLCRAIIFPCVIHVETIKFEVSPYEFNMFIWLKQSRTKMSSLKRELNFDYDQQDIIYE